MKERTTSARPRTSLWIPVHAAPFDRDLELAVVNGQTIEAIAFPCRREGKGWTTAGDRRPVGIDPTHWRHW